MVRRGGVVEKCFEKRGATAPSVTPLNPPMQTTLFVGLYNNYSMSPSWIWSDQIINERVARVGYYHFISNKGEWNNCFSKFSNRVLPPIFISTILQSVWKEHKTFKLGALFSI